MEEAERVEKQLTIKCGSVRKVFTLETRASDREIVAAVDAIDVAKIANITKSHVYVLADE